MPRKASATTSTEPPRRSSRITSQPKEVSKAAPKASKKRPAATASEGAAASDSAAKKAKTGEAKSEEQEPPAPQEEEAQPAAIASEDAAASDSGAKEAATGEAKSEEAAPAPKAEDSAKLAKIEIGDILPSGVTLKNEKGEDVDVAGLAAEKGVVLFLVPKADTPGCTTQACGFRDIHPDFTSVNYDVYCLSADTPEAQTKWQTKKELPFPLISDPKRILITALGAGEGGKTKRSHFIFEKGGKLLDKKNPVKPADSPKLALEFIKSL